MFDWAAPHEEIMMDKRLQRPMLFIGMALLLGSCGRIAPAGRPIPADRQSHTNATDLPHTATPTLVDPDAWAQNTPNDADKTTIANIEKGLLDEQNERATAFARPSAIPASNPLPTYIPPPAEVIPPGIQPYANCGTLDGDPVFSTENCWYDTRNGVVMQVDAGAMKSDHLGAIRVSTHTPGGATIPATVYVAPQTTRTLHIVSATYPSLVVADPNGNTFTFDLETRLWSAINSAPLPTPAAK
jgi:hypothetical protein